MRKFSITGMSCAACQARIEQVVFQVDGVEKCYVSLLTNVMGVEGNASDEEIINAVKSAGYGASVLEAANFEKQIENNEIPFLKKRLFSSLCFLFALMYVSMGYSMFNFPLPDFLIKNFYLYSGLQFCLCLIILIINRSFFINGLKSLYKLAPNMDTLVALGSGVSFLYSIILVVQKNNGLYFDSSAMIVTLITVGKLLEAVSKGKTTNALKGLMKLVPKTEIRVGDVFDVRPGESIPADGIVIEGTASVNESVLTGESMPVEKKEGSEVSCATINVSGFIKCRATRVGEDTILSQIIKLVSDASATKAPIAKIADKVSRIFVPSVILISLLTTTLWLFSGATLAFALTKAISVLVVSCPCALGLATPVAIMVGNGIGAKKGILFKSSVALETTGKARIVALDKTGTITKGQMEVTKIISQNETELINYAYNLEKMSEHPIAKAIVMFTQSKSEKNIKMTDFVQTGGKGVKAKIQNESGVIKTVYAGNKEYMMENCHSIFKNHEINKLLKETSEKGQTPVIFATTDISSEFDIQTDFLGIIAVADVIKDDAKSAVSHLKNMGIRVVMISGDNEITAKTIARQAGIDEVYANVLPQGKEKIINELKKSGVVVMAGDGINDAPALTCADVGIAIGGGTDIAIDAADVVLLNKNLEDIPLAVKLSKKTIKNIYENLFWAFFYNVALIPLAAGVYYNLFGIQMSPVFGAAAMSLSSFCVVCNALRLNVWYNKL